MGYRPGVGELAGCGQEVFCYAQVNNQGWGRAMDGFEVLACEGHYLIGAGGLVVYRDDVARGVPENTW